MASHVWDAIDGDAMFIGDGAQLDAARELFDDDIARLICGDHYIDVLTLQYDDEDEEYAGEVIRIGMVDSGHPVDSLDDVFLPAHDRLVETLTSMTSRAIQKSWKRQ